MRSLLFSRAHHRLLLDLCGDRSLDFSDRRIVVVGGCFGTGE
ncbi:MAG: hypothetical protein QNJ33_13585 [Crocosphaera sp.]|nr:hypothetical protein [Crocosphaera sp.]